MKEKRCVICNKTYNYNYNMFGRGCLNNVYEMLNISKPFKILNKESYLFNRIAFRNHKFFLSKIKKQELAKKYIALSYLNKINYESLKEIKEKIENDITNISVFSSKIPYTVSFTLNDIYKLYNCSLKFDELIKEFKNINWKEIDDKVAKNFIKSISFIFDITKISNPITYAVFYSMQYTFWQVVVLGGLFTEKPLSAKLLSNSLIPFGKKSKDLVIEDDEIINSIVNDENFKQIVKEIIKDNREVEDYEKDGVLISFSKGDLLYALHNSTLYIKLKNNNNNTWNLEIEINDTYDFTDFKGINKYIDQKDSMITDMLSTTLNNFGVVSSEYGVIKPYDVKIKFNLNNYSVE